MPWRTGVTVASTTTVDGGTTTLPELPPLELPPLLLPATDEALDVPLLARELLPREEDTTVLEVLDRLLLPIAPLLLLELLEELLLLELLLAPVQPMDAKTTARPRLRHTMVFPPKESWNVEERDAAVTAGKQGRQAPGL